MSIKNMSTRINFAGGHRQVDRMNRDKLKSLKKIKKYRFLILWIYISKKNEHLLYLGKIIEIEFDLCYNFVIVKLSYFGVDKINIM